MSQKRDYASIFLAFVLPVIVFANHFMFYSASRIGKKVGLSAVKCLGANYYPFLILTLILSVVVLIKGKNELFNFITGIYSGLCFALCALFAGQAANVVEFESASSRLSMSVGCYAYLICTFLIGSKCAEYTLGYIKKLIISLVAPLLTFIFILRGELDGISIMVEYFNREAQFKTELINHLKMSLSVVLTSIIIGVPLGRYVYKHKNGGKFLMSLLGTFESVPALALISIMMFPLAFLSNNISVLKKWGISGIGAAPVFLALLVYALFQIVNTVYGALNMPDKNYIEAARGMGMTSRQIFTKVELPLILPIIISGIRVALVSTILGVIIGAYVGFGGLGMFIVQGTAGFAIDIVLLVTIPIMLMIFVFDYTLKSIEDLIKYFERHRGKVRF
mgnify:FL=1